jgi:C1A family cysteine protease
MFKRAFLVLAAAAAVCATNTNPREHYEKLFFEAMTKFGFKITNGEEFIRRLQIFADNVDAIEAHNAKPNETFKMGINQFTHMTAAEWRDFLHLGGTRPPSLRRNANAKLHSAPVDPSALPASVDWTTQGAVTPVKNQGNCGSCWSFSTTGSLEGAYFLKYGNLLSFSEQELVSCDTTDSGCNGGWMDNAFEYITANGGITTEDQYPYTSGTTGQTGSCKTTGYTNVANSAPAGFTDVEVNNVQALMSAVAQQPVSIAIQANQASFQSYSGGVLTARCGQNLDHGVLAVGYGTLNGVDYWKVKNSWGATWGDEGYILIERSSANLCGVLSAPSYPNM